MKYAPFGAKTRRTRAKAVAWLKAKSFACRRRRCHPRGSPRRPKAPGPEDDSAGARLPHLPLLVPILRGSERIAIAKDLDKNLSGPSWPDATAEAAAHEAR